MPPAAAWIEHWIAWLHPVGSSEKVLGGEALEGDAGRVFLGNAVGEPDQPLRRHQAALRIGAVRRARIGDPVADRAFRHAVAHRFDGARALDAHDEGKFGGTGQGWGIPRRL